MDNAGMAHGRPALGARLAFVAAALLSLACGLATILAVDPGADPPTTYAAASIAAQIADIAAGLGLVVAGAFALTQPHARRPGLRAMLAGVAWLGANWEGADGPPLLQSRSLRLRSWPSSVPSAISPPAVTIATRGESRGAPVWLPVTRLSAEPHGTTSARLVPHRPIDPVSVPSVTMDAMVLPELPFLGCPVVGELTQLDADVVVLGIPHAVSYVVDEEEQRGLATAPAAVRKASQQFADDLMHHDFDLGHAFLREEGPRLVDVGDVPFAFGAGAENVRRADEGLAQIVGQGVMPLVIGGDDSIPPIIARALANHGTFDVVTIDAHLDFRDEIDGERFGRSSPARRMSELAQVTSVTQIGLRGIGSSRTSELEDARAAEHRVITAAEVHERGQRWLCDQLPSGRDVFVSIDCDGLDPSVAPGTGWPQPGGLTFRHVAAVIAELARTSRIAGGDVVELLPSRDVNGLTALTAARLLMLLADSRGQAARDAS